MIIRRSNGARIPVALTVSDARGKSELNQLHAPVDSNSDILYDSFFFFVLFIYLFFCFTLFYFVCSLTFRTFRCNDSDIGDHSPATCENVEMWKEKAADESENVNWMIANTKK